jgi:hypothetical protein
LEQVQAIIQQLNHKLVGCPLLKGWEAAADTSTGKAYYFMEQVENVVGKTVRSTIHLMGTHYQVVGNLLLISLRGTHTSIVQTVKQNGKSRNSKIQKLEEEKKSVSLKIDYC